jgi:ketosteroid isomerase-like protein
MAGESADIANLRAGYEALGRGEWDEAFRHLDPEVELTTADLVPNPGVYRGRDEVRRFFEDLLEPFEEVHIEPEEFFQRNDQIVAFLRITWMPSGTTATVENRVGHLWTVRDGRATHLRLFPRREEALEAVGMRQ